MTIRKTRVLALGAVLLIGAAACTSQTGGHSQPTHGSTPTKPTSAHTVPVPSTDPTATTTAPSTGPTAPTNPAGLFAKANCPILIKAVLAIATLHPGPLPGAAQRDPILGALLHTWGEPNAAGAPKLGVTTGTGTDEGGSFYYACYDNIASRTISTSLHQVEAQMRPELKAKNPTPAYTKFFDRAGRLPVLVLEVAHGLSWPRITAAGQQPSYGSLLVKYNPAV